MREHRIVELGVERLGTAKGLRGFRSLGGVTGIGASSLVLHRRDDLSNTQARPCSNLGMAGSRSVGTWRRLWAHRSAQSKMTCHRPRAGALLLPCCGNIL